LLKAIGFIKVTRIINSLMMGFAVLIGETIALRGSPPHFMSTLLGFITAFTLTGASMAVNDYYDRAVDAVNEPNRPIPSGIISPKETLVYAAALVIIGMLSAFFTNYACLITAAISLAVSMFYNTKGKASGLAGNFMVSFSVAIPFVYGGLVVKQIVNLSLLLFSSMAFLSNTGREVTKDIVDVEGDKIRNLKTIALVYGPKKAAIVAAFFYISAVFFSVIPIFLNLVTSSYTLPVVASDFGFIFCSMLLLKNFSRDNARFIKNTVLICMIAGLAAFIIGIY